MCYVLETKLRILNLYMNYSGVKEVWCQRVSFYGKFWNNTELLNIASFYEFSQKQGFFSLPNRSPILLFEFRYNFPLKYRILNEFPSQTLKHSLLFGIANEERRNPRRFGPVLVLTDIGESQKEYWSIISMLSLENNTEFWFWTRFFFLRNEWHTHAMAKMNTLSLFSTFIFGGSRNKPSESFTYWFAGTEKNEQIAIKPELWV